MASLMLALALAGCTGSGGNGDSDLCGEQDDQGRYVVCMTNSNRFVPSTLQVPVGATVVWINQGGTHNTQEANDLWASDITSASRVEENHVQVFEESGSFDYFCLPHQGVGMKGTIIVA